MTQTNGTASIGIDLGGTKCAGVVLDSSGAVVARHRVPTPNGGDAIIAAIVATATGLRNQAHALGLGDIDHLGIGMPGLVTPKGNLRFAQALCVTPASGPPPPRCAPHPRRLLGSRGGCCGRWRSTGACHA